MAQPPTPSSSVPRRSLGDLPYVKTAEEYRRANPGFALDYQFVDVPDYQGRGETSPLPYFYQNLAEAEYLVSTYMFMRLLGYPAAKISILTTYNGQKALLQDVVERRCASHPLFGRPHRIATVDKYQGQQNDYVLLSLVRTRSVGHLRDVRRLVVAMSRARLGMYIFGRQVGTPVFLRCSYMMIIVLCHAGQCMEHLSASAPCRNLGAGGPYRPPNIVFRGS